MRNIRHDLVHATRRLARSPLYTVFAVATLAVGIAATTSLYSLLSFVLWRPDAVVNPERVVELKGDTVIPGRSGVPGRFSWADWQSLAEQQQSFSHVAAVGRLAVSIFNEGAANMALGEGVTGDYFAMVGVPPLHGRVLSRADSAPDAPLVVVLSARVARAQFRDEARAVGQMLTISGQRAEVVGVVSDNLFGIGAAFMPATFWVPLEHSRAMPGISPAYFDPARRDARWLVVRGRLRDDVTLSRAAEELTLIGRRVEAAFPSVGVTTAVAAGTPSGRNWRAEPASTREAETFSRIGVAMMVGVMLALLMVCANLANLGLSRGAARQPEFAVRRALGASRWRIAREQLVECGLVVGMGTALALVAARWLITIMQVDVPIATGMTMSLQPEVTWPVAAMAAGAAALSMLFVGVGPAWRSAGADIKPLMAQEGATTPTRWRTQRRLVAVQVAGSVTLLLLALSVAQSVTHGTRAPGVDVKQLAVASVNFYLSPREVSQIDRLRDDVLQRVRQSPGVETAAAATSLPFGLGSSQGGVAPTDTELAANGGANAYVISGTADLLPTLGIPMVSGRTFSVDEVRETRPVIVLSETIARTLFGSTDVLGRVAWFRRGTPTKGVAERFTVIGVSRDTDTFVMGMRRSGAVFLPLPRDSGNQLVFVARTSGDPAAMAGVLRQSIREVDPALAIDIAGTGWSVLSGRYFFMAALAWVASSLGLLTLVLVMTGLFGVLSALVTQQTREFGIRMALGSTSADLLRLVVRQGLRPARDGLIIGLAIGVLSRVALGAILPSGLAVIDVLAFIVVPVVIVGTAVASSIIPARRAAAVDPNVALRTN